MRRLGGGMKQRPAKGTRWLQPGWNKPANEISQSASRQPSRLDEFPSCKRQRGRLEDRLFSGIAVARPRRESPFTEQCWLEVAGVFAPIGFDEGGRSGR